MKRIILAIAVAIGITSCSYLSEFYIYNDSKTQIQIEYGIQSVSEGHIFNASPELFSFIKYTDLQAMAARADQIHYATNEKMVTAYLDPGQALFIGNSVNFALGSDDNELYENLAFLNIKQDGSEVYLEGEMVVEYFEKLDKKSIYFGIVIQ